MATSTAASFGELLKQYRAVAGLTQEELAERARMSARAISDLERGIRHRPYAHTVQRLVQALDLSEEDTSCFQRAARRVELVSKGGLEPINHATPTTNLPIQPTTFIARRQEVEELRTLLGREDVRLITLTGTGGAGKTRLALQVAGGLVDRFPDGVWLVELAPLVDPALVPDKVLAAVGVPQQPGRSTWRSLLDAMQTRQLLLVLDNCEHLLDSCARLADALLRTCSQLRILATSRQPLTVAGETQWRVLSLSLPPGDQAASPAAVAQCEAVQFFLDRARQVKPSFALSTANAPMVADICTRLDGIPLALELAAARLSTLGIADLATHLDQRFRLLTGGSRTALPRQQTLQAAVEWSYDLLTLQERTLFAHLSVFAGGSTLEAAEAVGAGEGIDEEEVLDLLGRLVDRSLLVAEELEEGSTWFRLLETLRQYGWERLEAAGQTAVVQRRHACYYLTLVERAEPKLTGPDQWRWLDRLEREHDNLRVALARCLAPNKQAPEEDDRQDDETGLRMAGALHWFWLFRDHHAEGLAWLEKVLARGAAAPAGVRAKAFCNAGVLSGLVGDLVKSKTFLSQSIALSREVGDERQLSIALGVLGSTPWTSDWDRPSAAVLEESLALARGVGDPWLIGHALLHSVFRVANSAAIRRAEERTRAWAAGEEGLSCFKVAGDSVPAAVLQLSLGQIALHQGDYARARSAFVACLPVLRMLGWRTTVGDALAGLGDVAREQGDNREAAALYSEGVVWYRQVGDRLTPAIARILCRLADINLEHGDWAAAQIDATESLTIARDTGQVGVSEIADAVEAHAALAAARDMAMKAVRLAGAVAALRGYDNPKQAAPDQIPHARRLTSLPPSPRLAEAASGQHVFQRWLGAARQVLSADDQAAAWEEGQAMTVEQAIAYALDELPPAPCTLQPASGSPHGSEAGPLVPLGRPSLLSDAPASLHLSRTERQTWALDHLRMQGWLSPGAYATMLGVSVDTALRDLRELVDRGVVQATGRTRDRRYVLVSEALSTPIPRTTR